MVMESEKCQHVNDTDEESNSIQELRSENEEHQKV